MEEGEYFGLTPGSNLIPLGRFVKNIFEVTWSSNFLYVLCNIQLDSGISENETHFLTLRKVRKRKRLIFYQVYKFDSNVRKYEMKKSLDTTLIAWDTI